MDDLNQEILQRVEASMADFRAGMQATHDLSVRIGKRTTQFLRLFVLCMFILGIALIYLIVSLRQDMGGFVKQMEQMNESVLQMSASVGQMQHSTAEMVQPLRVMPDMSLELANMSQTMTTLNQRILLISGQMEALPVMSKDVNIIAKELNVMLREIKQMNSSLGRMAYDMDDISRPMRMFP